MSISFVSNCAIFADKVTDYIPFPYWSMRKNAFILAAKVALWAFSHYPSAYQKIKDNNLTDYLANKKSVLLCAGVSVPYLNIFIAALFRDIPWSKLPWRALAETLNERERDSSGDAHRDSIRRQTQRLQTQLAQNNAAAEEIHRHLPENQTRAAINVLKSKLDEDYAKSLQKTNELSQQLLARRLKEIESSLTQYEDELAELLNLVPPTDAVALKRHTLLAQSRKNKEESLKSRIADLEEQKAALLKDLHGNG